jgi:hypothetical protein
MAESPSRGGDRPGPGADHVVAATVHLLHRRRGWSWVLASSLVALLALAVIRASVWAGASGALAVLSDITLILLLAVAAAAVIMVITDTGRLRRRHAAVRTAAASRTAHHPVAHHPFRTPVHDLASHVFVWFILSIVLIVTALSLPDQVNAYAYVIGAGKSVTFMPQSYSLSCHTGRGGGGGCSTATNGVLETNPPVRVAWNGQVPLGQPFGVRQPVWVAWSTPTLMNGDMAADGIGAGLIFDLATAGVIAGFVHMMRRARRRRQGPVSPVTAGAHWVRSQRPAKRAPKRNRPAKRAPKRSRSPNPT